MPDVLMPMMGPLPVPDVLGTRFCNKATVTVYHNVKLSNTKWPKLASVS